MTSKLLLRSSSSSSSSLLPPPPQQHQRTSSSLRVFRGFMARRELGGGDSTLDVSGMLGKECYDTWLKLKNCEDSEHESHKYRRTLTNHVSGTDGRCPFDPEEEAAILVLLRQPNSWTCFRPEQAQYGRRYRAKGYHEKKRALLSSSSSPGGTAREEEEEKDDEDEGIKNHRSSPQRQKPQNRRKRGSCNARPLQHPAPPLFVSSAASSTPTLLPLAGEPVQGNASSTPYRNEDFLPAAGGEVEDGDAWDEHSTYNASSSSRCSSRRTSVDETDYVGNVTQMLHQLSASDAAFLTDFAGTLAANCSEEEYDAVETAAAACDMLYDSLRFMILGRTQRCSVNAPPEAAEALLERFSPPSTGATASAALQPPLLPLTPHDQITVNVTDYTAKDPSKRLLAQNSLSSSLFVRDADPRSRLWCHRDLFRGLLAVGGAYLQPGVGFTVTKQLTLCGPQRIPLYMDMTYWVDPASFFVVSVGLPSEW